MHGTSFAVLKACQMNDMWFQRKYGHCTCNFICNMYRDNYYNFDFFNFLQPYKNCLLLFKVSVHVTVPIRNILSECGGWGWGQSLDTWNLILNPSKGEVGGPTYTHTMKKGRIVRNKMYFVILRLKFETYREHKWYLFMSGSVVISWKQI